jgi:tetratricopeptide (TPR) repeat protein
VTNLFVSLLSALLATNQPVAVSNLVVKPASTAVSVTDTNDPVEKEFQRMLEADDSSQEAVDQVIRDEESFAAQGAAAPAGTVRDRIEARFAPVRKSYEDFLQRHPDHARARLAYGSFLSDLKDEAGAHDQWEKARELDPTNPAAWNNLANYYGHCGPITNAFDYYAKAIALNPDEPLYYQNYGTTVYLFRQDAKEHFKINEQQVFDKALDLYGRALRLDPTNFILASDIAQTFYGITPPRTNAALLAWNYALSLARDDIEREGVYVHLARIKGSAGRFDEARRHLDAVTNAMYADLKRRVLRSLEFKEAEARGTNAPPAQAGKK